MGMAKTGYITAYAGKATEKLNLNRDGNIAQEGETVASTKRITMPGLNPENNLETNHNVIQLFYDIVGGYTDELSNKFTVTWEALG